MNQQPPPSSGMPFNQGQQFFSEAANGTENVVNTQAYKDLSQEQQEQILKQLE